MSAREHLRCLCQTLSILSLELRLPEHILRPVDLKMQEKRLFDEDGRAYLWSPETGTATWDCLQPASAREIRVSLQPDEGSPMFCTAQFLQQKHFRIIFLRDELCLDFRFNSLVFARCLLLCICARSSETQAPESLPQSHGMHGHYQAHLASHIGPCFMSCCLPLFNIPGATTLTSWLMKAKRSPWQTSRVGQTWSEASRRYLDIASSLQI